MSRSNRISLAIVRSPLIWGALATLGFYVLIHAGIWRGEFALRYFAGHWVEYIETAMFFVGLAELVLKGLNIAWQRAGLNGTTLSETAAGSDSVGVARTLLAPLQANADRARSAYLPRRLCEALDSIVRNGSADKLDEELKYLSDVDATRAHSANALVRIIIWAIPILGFLGTVIGITLAIASLSPQALEDSLPVVTGGLGVAFDTTALALGLSMVLMFGQYFVDKLEGRLLAEVDERAANLLAGRFEQALASTDPNVASVRRMCEAVVKATERISQQQADMWRATIDAAHERWSQLCESSERQIQAALSGALSDGLKSFAQELATAAETSADRNRRQWTQLQASLNESTAHLGAQQAELARQGQVLLQVVEATGQVTRLENTLNENLAALASAQHFEEAMVSLSATLNLLNARLGATSAVPHVDLKSGNTMGKAA